MADEIKRVNATQLDAGLTLIADAIRNKTGDTEVLEFPNGMVEAIENISTGGVKVYEISEPSFSYCPLWIYSSVSTYGHKFTINTNDYVILSMNLYLRGNQYSSTQWVITYPLPNGEKFYNGIPINTKYSYTQSTTGLPNSTYEYPFLTFTTTSSWDGVSKLTFSIIGTQHKQENDFSTGEDYPCSFDSFGGSIKYTTKAAWQEWINQQKS